jgi:hypothetical protein
MLILVLAAAVGFSLHLPGIALASLGGIALQPVLILSAMYVAIAVIGQRRIPLGIVGWIMINVAALAICTVMAVDAGHPMNYLAIHIAYLLVFALAFGMILTDPLHRHLFLHAYIAGALVGSAVALAQFASSTFLGIKFLVTNNENFFLIAPPGRGVGFTPEASILATLLLPGFVILYAEIREKRSFLNRRFRTLPVLGFLGAGLLATKSSSIMLLPVIILAYEIVISRSILVFIGRNLKNAIIFGLLALAFIPLYQTRLATDDAQYSSLYRLEKMEVGLRIYQDYPVAGAGLGRVSDTIFFERYLDPTVDWDWLGEHTWKGVDSWVIRTMAETGTLGLLALYLPLLIFFPSYWRLSKYPEFRPLLVMTLSFVFCQALVSGYRDLPFFYLPMTIATLAGTGALTPSLVPRRRAEPPVRGTSERLTHA